MTTRRNLPTIASFWFGSDLSWMEALCIQSYLDHGHRFVLYMAEDCANVPEGVDMKPASEIYWPPPFDVSDKSRLRVAVFSDIFRLKMIQKTGFVWVDLDAFCVLPFDFDTPYIFSISEAGLSPNGVLGLPQSSPTLENMLRFVTSDCPIQPWRGKRFHKKRQAAREQGEHWGIEDLNWGCSGPRLFGHFLQQSGEAVHAMPIEVLYPLIAADLRMLHDRHVATDEIEREGVCSVHFYGHQKKIIADHFDGLPVASSYLERVCERHSINPAAMPVERLPWMIQKDVQRRARLSEG